MVQVTSGCDNNIIILCNLQASKFWLFWASLGQLHVNSHFHCDVEGRMDIRGTVPQLEKPGNNATDYLPIKRLRKIGGRVNVRALDTR